MSKEWENRMFSDQVQADSLQKQHMDLNTKSSLYSILCVLMLQISVH